LRGIQNADGSSRGWNGRPSNDRKICSRSRRAVRAAAVRLVDWTVESIQHFAQVRRPSVCLRPRQLALGAGGCGLDGRLREATRVRLAMGCRARRVLSSKWAT
jgi:hypothetical protein